MKSSTNMELLTAYRQGWKHGASSAFRGKSNTPTVDAEYQRGYADGLADRIAADRAATQRLGVTEKELLQRVLR